MKSNQSQIMRRVYYSYALSYTEQPMLYIGLGLGAGVALLGRWTHVASITDNLLATPVGNVPSFISGAFMTAITRGELGTVLIVLTVTSLAVVAGWQIIHLRSFSRLEFKSKDLLSLQ